MSAPIERPGNPASPSAGGAARSRRDFLRTGALLGAACLAPPAAPDPRAAAPSESPTSRRTPAAAAGRGMRVIVVGAGAFGGWTALHLLRGGADVTLIDAWGPGNSRASSGGETRVIRAIYGGARRHTLLAARALALWKENEARWQQRIHHRTGALWMFDGPDDYLRASLDDMKEAGLPVRHLERAECARRFPQIRFDGLLSVHFEPEAGFLMAREACRIVRDAFVSEGGTYLQAAVPPLDPEPGEGLPLLDGTHLHADRVVLACGAWLSSLLPDLLGSRIHPTRQEVFFFGTPAGDPRFEEGAMPVWVEIGEEMIYGIPANGHRGFKCASDTRGPSFDPTDGERNATEEGLARARRALARRFPSLSSAPLLEARVCQYENSPDGEFILARHPRRPSLWILGGGSGHGFKMGPAIGEHAAQAILERAEPDPGFSLYRFEAIPS